MKKYYADNRSLNFLRVTVFLLLIAIIFGLRFLAEYLGNRFPSLFVSDINIPEVVAWAVAAALAAAYIVIILIILPLWYKSICYSVSHDEIIFEAGVFFRNRHYMKLPAVQYVSLITMPFSKITGFNFVVISAHGGRLVCLFLSKRDAMSLSSRITRYLKNFRGMEY